MFEFLLIIIIILVCYGLYRLMRLLEAYVNHLNEDGDRPSGGELLDEYLDRQLREDVYNTERLERERQRDPLKDL